MKVMVSKRMDEDIKELIDEEENGPGVVGVEEERNRRTKEAQCSKDGVPTMELTLAWHGGGKVWLWFMRV
ncbi:unnamed protein product [Lathyrus oleraceus]